MDVEEIQVQMHSPPIPTASRASVENPLKSLEHEVPNAEGMPDRKVSTSSSSVSIKTEARSSEKDLQNGQDNIDKLSANSLSGKPRFYFLVAWDNYVFVRSVGGCSMMCCCGCRGKWRSGSGTRINSDRTS